MTYSFFTCATMSANNGLVVLNYYLYRSEMWRSKRYVWIHRRASRIIINQWDYTRVIDREEIRSSVFCNLKNCGSTILHEFMFRIFSFDFALYFMHVWITNLLNSTPHVFFNVFLNWMHNARYEIEARVAVSVLTETVMPRKTKATQWDCINAITVVETRYSSMEFVCFGSTMNVVVCLC